MSDLEAIKHVVARAAARRRWLFAWRGLWTAFLCGAVLWLLTLATYKLFPVPFAVLGWSGIAAVVLTLLGFVRGWVTAPTAEQTARWLDRWDACACAPREWAFKIVVKAVR